MSKSLSCHSYCGIIMKKAVRLLFYQVLRKLQLTTFDFTFDMFIVKFFLKCCSKKPIEVQVSCSKRYQSVYCGLNMSLSLLFNHKE